MRRIDSHNRRVDVLAAGGPDDRARSPLSNSSGNGRSLRKRAAGMLSLGRRCSIAAPVLAAIAAALVSAPAPASAQEGTAVVSWGKNLHEQLGSGFKSSFEKRPVTVAGLSNIAAVASGWEDNFALLSNGTVRAWGYDIAGQLGNNQAEVTIGTPTPVKNAELGELTNVAAIAASGDHNMALLKNGRVLTWGGSQDGTRGNGESGVIGEAEQRQPYANRYVAATGPVLHSPAKQIAAAGRTDYALLENGEVMAWGGNGNGKLGIGVEPGKGKETPAPETCKLESPLAQREAEEAEGKEPEAGNVACSKVPRQVQFSFTPRQLEEHVFVTAITGGYDAAYAVLSNGEVMAWGNGGDGLLGTGNEESSDRPVPVNTANVPACPEQSASAHCPVVEVSASQGFVWALTESGEVIGWGMNVGGQLGSESTEECKKAQPDDCSMLPKRVIAPGEIGRVTAISAGRAGAGEALSNGVMYSLGSNEPWGQLGTGSEMINTRVPEPIEGLAPVASMDAGEGSSVALLQSGPGPAPLLTVTPGKDSLTVNWTAGSPQGKLRWTVVTAKGEEVEEAKGKEKEASVPGECSAVKPCSYTITKLNPAHMYSVRLQAKPEPNRFIYGTPLS